MLPVKFWVKLYACVEFCGEVADDGGEALRFEREHVAVHELPVRETGGSWGEHDFFTVNSCLVNFAVEAVFFLQPLSHCSNEQINISVHVRSFEGCNMVACYELVIVIKRFADTAAVCYCHAVIEFSHAVIVAYEVIDSVVDS